MTSTHSDKHSVPMILFYLAGILLMGFIAFSLLDELTAGADAFGLIVGIPLFALFVWMCVGLILELKKGM